MLISQFLFNGHSTNLVQRIGPGGSNIMQLGMYLTTYPRSFQTHNSIFKPNECEKMSIQQQHSNPRSLEHESSHITASPGLMSKNKCCCVPTYLDLEPKIKPSSFYGMRGTKPCLFLQNFQFYYSSTQRRQASSTFPPSTIVKQHFFLIQNRPLFSISFVICETEKRLESVSQDTR